MRGFHQYRIFNMAGHIVYLCALTVLYFKISHGHLLVSSIDTSNLETSKKQLSESNQVYAHEITSLRKEIMSLQHRVKELELTSQSFEVGYNITTKAKDNQDIDVHVIKKRAVRRRRRKRVHEVAFQASLTTEFATFRLGDAIIFNHVITNIGRHYDKNTGIFTAPIAGTYIFFTNIVAEEGHYVEASVKVNDEVTVSAISDHRVSPKGDKFGIWDQGNAVAILRLRKWDKVSITMEWPQGYHDIHGVRKSSFSGYLMMSHELH